jgi:hypothetical protein
MVNPLKKKLYSHCNYIDIQCQASHGARRHFIGKKIFVGQDFQPRHRGWKAAPTENDPTYLEEKIGNGMN